MTRRVAVFAALVIFCCASGGMAAELEYYKVYKPETGMTADEIMQIVYHNKYSLFARDYDLPESEIFYVDPSGLVRTKLAERYRKVEGGSNDIQYKDLVVVTHPTSVKGLAILTWTFQNPERDQDVWLWIPAIKKVRKISASEDDDAFMGSDLTVEEVSTRRFEDETYRLIGEKDFDGYRFEHTGEMKFQGRPCFVIEAEPVNPHWYYAKRTVWVDKEMGGAIFEEYEDRNGDIFKTIYREWDWYTQGDLRYPTQNAIECKDQRTGHRTVVLNKNQKYDEGLDDSTFSLRTLQRSKW